ncbi:hypothetical protein EVAR_78192_1 [Eumeta japonica]|uniref:Uncharacterized protein n=1 Tax=Eumeta variegata TaxID=151549 RepID=A0A4C1V081_EUMVA|nr:hypothetical protein EVAR_78192_1 [Eumeta japonica]
MVNIKRRLMLKQGTTFSGGRPKSEASKTKEYVVLSPISTFSKGDKARNVFNIIMVIKSIGISRPVIRTAERQFVLIAIPPNLSREGRVPGAAASAICAPTLPGLALMLQINNSFRLRALFSGCSRVDHPLL